VLECEVGGYLVRARRTDAWDAIVSLLVTLEDEHSDYFHAVMHGCRRLSNSTPELDGLDDLLLAPEQHLHDEAIERERRRSRQGYATPADARAFLQMARRPQRPPHQSAATHPIVAPYFRATDEPSDEPIDEEEASAATAVPAERDQDVAASKMRESIEMVVELLTETGVMPQRPRALLAAAEEDPRAARLAVLRRSMAFVLEHDETAYMARSRELAFLANTLLAGCSVQSRPFTAAEASDAAACICNLGLECWTSRPGSTLAERGRESLPDAFLVDHDLIAAFEVGWSVLYEDVSLFAADRLIATLSEFQGADADTRDQLRGLQRTLTSAREAGTPWRARDAADVLAMLDTTAWISVVGLLDECPILPEALTAVLERRTTPVSPTAFEFISTAAQLGDIRLFMTTLASVLAR
jgi:hypothetical protein